MPNSPASDNMGRRDDDGKPEFNLIPSDGLRELGRVFSFGAKKYEPYNWERGMAWSRCYNSLLRHLYAYWDGERNDAETGLHHMAHCAWNALALLVYSLRGVGIDDRKGSEAGGRAGSETFCTPQKIPQSVKDEIRRYNDEVVGSRLPIEEAPRRKVGMSPALGARYGLEGTKADVDRLAEIERAQPIRSVAEIKEGLKFKAYGSQVVWTISRLIMSSLNTFQAKDEFDNEQMFHLRAIAEIVA